MTIRIKRNKVKATSEREITLATHLQRADDDGNSAEMRAGKWTLEGERKGHVPEYVRRLSPLSD